MNTNLFYKKTLFSKSIKKRTFKDFGWQIGVRFFFQDLEKTHLNLATKIRQKITFFLRFLKKTHLNLAPKIPQKITFFLRFLKKTHLDLPPKITQTDGLKRCVFFF